jgi:hypothetical protein
MRAYCPVMHPEGLPVSKGFVGDCWFSITLTLCHKLHIISRWPVLERFINPMGCRAGEEEGCLASLISLASCLLPAHASTGVALVLQQLHFFFQLILHSMSCLQLLIPGLWLQ